ncbi:hypothetical protein [Paenibacillus sp. OAS669]|uniref:hypothetical protein n=1 Tax=Paenibacillus sp. OAS669 TaxID=2663821 RepID=UPI00178C0D4A|nr:hypothetical protein [Paenibacillus sp. OAS669]MBE1445259.1 hypothetical protein [Paenibacillus sp. OAS669]
MNWNILIIIVLLVINYPLYRFLFSLFFYDEDEFEQSVKYSFTPNFISFFRGEYWKDKFSTMRLQAYSITCILLVVIEFAIIHYILELFR